MKNINLLLLSIKNQLISIKLICCIAFGSALTGCCLSHNSLYENYEIKVKNLKFFGEISNNWPNDLLGANI